MKGPLIVAAAAPNKRIHEEIETIKKFPQVKSVEVLPKEVHPGYETVRIAFIPPNLRITLNYSAAARTVGKGNMANVIGVYEPPYGMGDWTIDIHIPKKVVTTEQLMAESRYGGTSNWGTGSQNLCWKLVEIADAEYFNQSIYGTGFTGHIYYEGIQSQRGNPSVVKADKVFKEAEKNTGHRQHSLAFCLEDRISRMLREACLGGRLAEAFSIVYDLAGQTHYKPPKEYSHIKGNNAFYGKKEDKKGALFAAGSAV